MHEPVAAAALPAPTPEQKQHAGRVQRHLVDAIDARHGWISFADYMELALYAPGLGYYAAGARKFGDSLEGGDFVTAPEISPWFGRCLAAQVIDVARRLGQRRIEVLEFGAGTGRLARDLFDALRAHGCDARYSIVEISPDLRQRQRARLREGEFAWLDAPPADFEGVVIANEVLDVMPVQLFVKRHGEVFERGVAATDGRLRFADRPAATALSEQVRRIEAEVGPLADGYGSEAGSIAQAWVRSAAAWLQRGAMLLIDYGFPRREYYHPQRLMGTLMCHYRQHAHADPLWLPGLNDITAHVDFTAIAEAAHDAGFDVSGYTTQAHFLINCGMVELLERDTTLAQRSAAHRLLSEAEMGELFKVLALGRHLDVASEPLLGFRRGDRRHTL